MEQTSPLTGNREPIHTGARESSMKTLFFVIPACTVAHERSSHKNKLLNGDWCVTRGAVPAQQLLMVSAVFLPGSAAAPDHLHRGSMIRSEERSPPFILLLLVAITISTDAAASQTE